MENQNERGQLDATINRILLVSPMQAETFRRNRSRIFISIEGESMLDTMLFQSSRPMDLYMDIAYRAIAQANLNEDFGELKAIHGHQVGEFGGSHITTQSWLKDENGTVFDMHITLDHVTGLPGLQDSMIERIAPAGIDGENPLLMMIDVESFANSDPDIVVHTAPEPVVETQVAQPVARQPQDDVRIPGARGRVRDPETDRRLRSNRGDARRPQDEEPKKPAGKRGRVRSKFDMRLSGNRGDARRPQDDMTAPGGGAQGRRGTRSGS